MRATKAIIHIDKFQQNITAVRTLIGPTPLICVPVKANAYGHGAVALARAAVDAGAQYLAVATVDEGAQLRKAGISVPIVLLSIPLPEEFIRAVQHQLTLFVADHEGINLAVHAASSTKQRVPVHLKIDTGMGRIGCRPEEAVDLARHIVGSPALEYAGTATHLAASDSQHADDILYTQQQLARFTSAIESIRQSGINPGIVHAANSGGVVLHPASYFDMVRPGIVLYGYSPVPALLPVQPVMELVTQIVGIKNITRGESISYGRTWVAPADTTIATLPVGYGDGLNRLLTGKHRVCIHDAFYPLVGRICMDQCMVDLGPDTTIRRWEQVTIFGGVADSAAIVASRIGTIPYEVTCNIAKRVPRLYRGA